MSNEILNLRNTALPLVDGLDSPIGIKNPFCPANEHWTPFLVFTTPKLFPCSGILQMQKERGVPSYWIIDENNSKIDIDCFEEVFDDKELTNNSRLSVKTNYTSFRSLADIIQVCLSVDPFIKITLEAISKPLECSFGITTDSNDSILEKLAQFQSNVQNNISAAKRSKTSSASAGSSSKNVAYMQPVQSAHSASHLSSEKSSEKVHHVEQPVCMRVSIVLNDSALFNYMGDAFRENSFAANQAAQNIRMQQTLVYALRALELARKHLPLCCRPTPVSTKPRIPKLVPAHGLLLDLFDYQRRSVNWMLSVEQRVVQKKSEVRVLAPEVVAYSTLPFIYSYANENSVGLLYANRHFNRTQALDVHGGILAAKTGSGKTTTTIALIYLQRVLEQEIERWPSAPGDVASLPAHRAVPKWVPLGAHCSNRYYVNCTLVVAPRQVVQQWADEFQKTISPEKQLRVQTIGNINELRKLTIEQITMSIDVLIVNKQIFASPAYREVAVDLTAPGIATYAKFYEVLKGKESPSPTATSTSESSTNSSNSSSSNNSTSSVAISSSSSSSSSAKESQYGNWRISYNDATERAVLEYVLQRNREATVAQPAKYPPGSFFKSLMLHVMHFRRVVIDEVHELDSSWSMIERAVCSLSADTKWGLTATPGFDGHHAFQLAKDYTGKEMIHTGYPALLSVTRGSASLLASETMWPRYYFAALNSVTSSEVSNLPRINLHRVGVSLTPMETAIYNSISPFQKKKQLMFCSHHILDDPEWQALLLRSASDDDDEKKLLRMSSMNAAQVAEVMQRDRAAKMQKQLQQLQNKTLNVEKLFQDAVMSRCGECQIVQDICNLENNRESKILQVDAIIRLIEKNSVYVMRDPSSAGSIMQMDADDSIESAKNSDVEIDVHESKDFCPMEEKDENHRRDHAANLRAEQQALNERAKNLEFFSWSEQKADPKNFRLVLAHSLIDFRESIISAERQVREAQSAYESTRREYTFFEAVLRRVTHPDEAVECPICLDDGEATRHSLVLSSCGHEMCHDCATAHFKKSSNCPQCRAKLKLPDDLRLIDRRAVSKEPEPGQVEKQQMDDKYGSKLAQLLVLIEKLMQRPDGRKIIVHSQFEGLLRLTSAALKEFGIGHVYVGGAISQCQRAITQFKQDADVQIMLLSSENTISGISLVEANHMIVIHPPMGENEESSFATFWQAAGRIRRVTQTKECHIWSLVTQNTIEEKLYDGLLVYSKRSLENDDGIVWNAGQDIDSQECEIEKADKVIVEKVPEETQQKQTLKRKRK